MTDIHILNITHYMSCPPKSGGLLRMISPLQYIEEDSGISIDFLFGEYDCINAFKYCRFLERIPVVHQAKYVIYEQEKDSLKNMPDDFSDEVWKTLSRSLLKKAVEMVSKTHYDIIQLEHSFLAWMVPNLRKASPLSKIILDAHNVEYRIFELWNKYLPSAHMYQKAESLKNWEFNTWNLYDGTFVVSSVEEDLIRKNSNLKKIYLVPTGGGIDVEKYVPKENVIDKPYDILYIGTMEWFPNAHGLMWFIEKVLPIIEKKRPGTKLYIIGSGKPNAKLISMTESNPYVEFLGFQPDDVYFFHHSKVFIVPLWIGGGARVKIPTAWASGIPVVSTTFGAEGNFASDGDNILLADDPNQFAECVLNILSDSALAEYLSKNSIETVKNGFSTKICAEKLVSAYRDLVM